MEQPKQENFEGLDLTKLPIDTVHVYIGITKIKYVYYFHKL